MNTVYWKYAVSFPTQFNWRNTLAPIFKTHPMPMLTGQETIGMACTLYFW